MAILAVSRSQLFDAPRTYSSVRLAQMLVLVFRVILWNVPPASDAKHEASRAPPQPLNFQILLRQVPRLRLVPPAGGATAPRPERTA